MKKKAFIEALPKSLGIIEPAMRAAGIGSRRTVYRWKDADEAFEEAEAEAGDFVETQLLKLIREGNPTAIIFYCKTKLRSRGYHENVDVTSGGQAIVPAISVEIIDSRDKVRKEEGQNEGRSVMQYPSGSSAQYVTWPQASENLKFHVDTLRGLYFTQLQLPDWSYDKMSQQALSGESRKQLFIDCQLKVRDESGRLLEFFDREANVVKAMLKQAAPPAYAKDIEALPVANEITPFSITDDKDTIANLVTATGGKPVMSQREAVEMLGWSDDVDNTLKEIQEEGAQSALQQYE